MSYLNNMIHALLCFDHNNVMQAGVAILSVCENNKGHVILHAIVDDDVTQDDKGLLNSIVKRYGVELNFYAVDNTLFANSHGGMHISKGTYYRFQLPYLPLEGVNRMLYIDTDIVANGPLDEIWSTELTDNDALGAVPDRLLWTTGHSPVGFPAGSVYYNAGVQLINLDYWRKNDVSNKCMEYVFENDPKYMDQDAINVICNGHIKTLGEQCNFNPMVDRALFRNIGEFPFPSIEKTAKTPVLFHYYGPTKPWHLLCPNPEVWLKYYRMSPWGDQEISIPRKAATKTQEMIAEMGEDYGYWIDRYVPTYLELIKKTVNQKRWIVASIKKLCKIILKVVPQDKQ